MAETTQVPWTIAKGKCVAYGKDQQYLAHPGDEEKLAKHLSDEQVAALTRKKILVPVEPEPARETTRETARDAGKSKG